MARAKVEAIAPAGDGRSMRLAYADPPYPGKARRYYGDHPDYAGEVDHWLLLGELEGFDGWALSTSSAALPKLCAMADRRGLEPRVAVWRHRPAPHPTATLVTEYEAVIYSPARRPGDRLEGRAMSDVLEIASRGFPTRPGMVVGAKPPAFSVWVFRLLGARRGDDLADLYPGSGLVAWAWEWYLAGGPARQLPIFGDRELAELEAKAARSVAVEWIEQAVAELEAIGPPPDPELEP